MAKSKILIVEDDALIALHLKMSLSQAGYSTFGPVARGEDAIVQAREENPDIILIDIRLIGNMDGIETARQIREFSCAKIIFTTGHSDLDLKDRASALNPEAYLVKPIETREILSVVKQVESR